jgi:hypothetical protein
MSSKPAPKQSKHRPAKKKATPSRAGLVRHGKAVEPVRSSAAGNRTFRLVDGFPVDITGREVLPTPLKSRVGAKRIAKAVKAVVGA